MIVLMIEDWLIDRLIDECPAERYSRVNRQSVNRSMQSSILNP